MRAPVAANGWPKASDEPLHVELGAIDRRPAAASLPRYVLAIRRVFPGLQRAQHLRGEGLVDLVEVEVLQREAGAVEHLRDGDGRRHQQPVAADEIVGGVLAVGEVGEDRQVARLAPTPRCRAARPRRRRSAASSWRPSACRARILSKAGFSVPSFSSVDVGAHVVVAVDAGARHDQIVHVAFDRRRRRAFCGSRSASCVLIGARNVPLLRHQLGSARPSTSPVRGSVDDGGLRRQLAGREALEDLQLVERGLALLRRRSRRLANFFENDDRRVRRRVGADGDRAFDLAGRDLGRRASAPPAGDVPQACMSVMPGVEGASFVAEHGFAREVEILGVRDDRAADDLVDVLALEAVPVDERRSRRRPSCRGW